MDPLTIAAVSLPAVLAFVAAWRGRVILAWAVVAAMAVGQFLVTAASMGPSGRTETSAGIPMTLGGLAWALAIGGVLLGLWAGRRRGGG